VYLDKSALRSPLLAIYVSLGAIIIWMMKSRANIYLIILISFTSLFSCNKNELGDIETNHIIINNTDIYIDSILYWYACRSYPPYTTLYNINPHDTSEVYTLIKACKESEFEIFIDSTLYWGEFNWSLAIDPTDDLLKHGCYIFYIVNLDSKSKYATIASRFDRDCLFTR
jgi:hypothetical protein